MKRIVDYYLIEWKNAATRKPLLLRGARQVGKTYAARELGKTYDSFVEINLETNEEARYIFEKTLDVKKIVFELEELYGHNIGSSSTLLFIDEIQQVPQAITALRYFYELLPDLPIIAAGSLLDFAIEQVGIPVGRVTSLYMYPISFLEFLVAQGHYRWVQAIVEHDLNAPLSQPLHEKILEELAYYLAIGGMPEAVMQWVSVKKSRQVKMVHADLCSSYKQDFGKYAKKHQIKYLDELFNKAVTQLGRKFIFQQVGEYKKRELAPALTLLEKAGIVHRVVKSAGQGIPLGAYANPDDFKIIFLDVALSQHLLDLDLTQWFLQPRDAFINNGELVEAFVGQELLAYADPIDKKMLYYWRRDKQGAHAEVDYLLQINQAVVPVEVKAGSSRHIKSMHLFFQSHLKSAYGIRFSTLNYEQDGPIHSYPLYAVVKPLFDVHEELREAINFLIKS